jgi:7-carboxy-7-deazaguanine synthase
MVYCSGAMKVVNVVEIFESIQGESSYAGLSCFFIRLSGCNLRCRYCDTTYAYETGEDVRLEELVEKAASSSAAIIEITGGEPLLQAEFNELSTMLRDAVGRPVLVETNGSCDISIVPEGVITIMDIKCPSSGESEKMEFANIGRLRREDEVKFVISNKADFDWAADMIKKKNLTTVCKEVFLYPAYNEMEAQELGGWIVSEGLPVRLGVQLHKILNMP